MRSCACIYWTRACWWSGLIVFALIGNIFNFLPGEARTLLHARRRCVSVYWTERALDWCSCLDCQLWSQTKHWSCTYRPCTRYSRTCWRSLPVFGWTSRCDGRPTRKSGSFFALPALVQAQYQTSSTVSTRKIGARPSLHCHTRWNTSPCKTFQW